LLLRETHGAPAHRAGGAVLAPEGDDRDEEKGEERAYLEDRLCRGGVAGLAQPEYDSEPAGLAPDAEKDDHDRILSPPCLRCVPGRDWSAGTVRRSSPCDRVQVVPRSYHERRNYDRVELGRSSFVTWRPTRAPGQRASCSLEDEGHPERRRRSLFETVPRIQAAAGGVRQEAHERTTRSVLPYPFDKCAQDRVPDTLALVFG
jgi:hypothetical protein